jgi:glycosyltransferase involved in cell wall biosynthesis
MAPIRVLSVVDQLPINGLSMHVMEVLRHTDRRECAIDVMTHTVEPQHFDEEARRLGTKVLPCLSRSRPWRYAKNFRRILREHGPYDIVHCHLRFFSALVLRLARRAGVPVRIAQSHSAGWHDNRRPPAVVRALMAMARRSMLRHLTRGIGVSEEAAASLFGPRWHQDPRIGVSHCCIDLERFHQPVDTDAVRHELGLPEDAFVLGHVGRVGPGKNHRFLLHVASELRRSRPDTCVLIVGDGPAVAEVRQCAQELGIAGQVVFAGFRSDVPRLMAGAMDVFVLPSFYEGLPLVLVEAQAAGLPCVYSDVITREVEVVPGLMHARPLTAPPSAWAEAILVVQDDPTPVSPVEALAAVETTDFNIRRGVEALLEIYREGLGRAREART